MNESKPPTFPKWLEREREDYFASRRGATEAGFRKHVMELVRANPELAELMVEDYFTEMWKEIRREQQQ